MDKIDEKYEKLKEILKNMGSVLVAFSGGVDSTLLLKAASDTLKSRAGAATAVSYIYPSWETVEAQEFASSLGVEYVRIKYDPIGEVPDFYKNPANRCYICKKHLFSKLVNYAENMGFAYVVDGTNADDIKDYRPGLKAIEELQIKSPLLMADLHKSEIREILKRMGIEVYKKPSFACLATRLPVGDIVTEEKLLMIDKAEIYIMSKGIKNIRVRLHKDIARIEVNKEDMNKFFDMNFIEDIEAKLKEIGFKYVTLDLTGYKTGSMNLDSQKGEK